MKVYLIGGPLSYPLESCNILTRQAQIIWPITNDWVIDGFKGLSPLSSNSFIFMQFSAEILPNNRFVPKLRDWHPQPSFKSWICHWESSIKYALTPSHAIFSSVNELNSAFLVVAFIAIVSGCCICFGCPCCRCCFRSCGIDNHELLTESKIKSLELFLSLHQSAHLLQNVNQSILFKDKEMFKLTEC